MTASDLYKAGKLQAAVEAQLADVKANPADPGRRIFLFELAAFSGDLERARRQIDAVQHGDPERDMATLGYRALIDAEEKRRRVFRDGVEPRYLGEAPAHLRRRVEAAGHLRAGRQAEAAAMLAKANEGAEAIKGTLNGKPFAGLRDADDLLAGVLEVMARGEYFWVALSQVEAIASNPPRFPRDLLYMPARLTTADGEAEVFLPLLYPNSHEHPDEGVKLGKDTDWKQAEGGPTLGVGAKTFLVGDDGVGLVEWRELVLGDES